MFNKKINKEFHWDYEPTKRFHSDVDINEYLTPAKDDIPDWFKKADQAPQSPGIPFMSVKTCPSFIELWKNSYIYRCPCDVNLDVSKMGSRFSTPDEVDSHWHISSHTHSEDGKISQMGPFFDKDLVNVKFNPNLTIQASNVPEKVIFFPPIYHNTKADLQVAPGIVEFLPSFPLSPALNFFVDLRGYSKGGYKTINIKAGDPLAYLYFPLGIKKLKRKSLMRKPRRKFFGDYTYHRNIASKQPYAKNLHNSKISKCPFKF